MKNLLNSVFNHTQQISFYNIWSGLKTKSQSESIWLENITTLKM